MAINKKLIHFQKKETFNTKLHDGEILDTSIVFIKDTKEIWTHGQIYPCPYTEAEIANMLTNATTVKDGFMSKEDKTKLNGIATGAEVNAVTSVSGKTGAVTLSKMDVGLDNIDNTADADKPISSATQLALNKKVDTTTYTTEQNAQNTRLTNAETSIGKKVDTDIYNAGQSAQDERLSKIESLVTGSSANPELFRKANNVAIGAWVYDDLNPDAVDFYGNKSVADCWDFVLVDCEATANADGTQPIVGKLKHNNLLRFADGRFAPTVGITEAMRAECDVELYLDAEHTQKYCDAGGFNAESFYNEHGMANLYNAEGTEVRVLRPWETTETKYSIFLATDKDLYPIDRLVGESGTEWSGVMDTPLKWDGLDVEKFKLAPTGISPTSVCTVGNKSRCFFFTYEVADKNCGGSDGAFSIVTMFNNNRTYPRHSDIYQGTAGIYARANNADATSSYPFAEGGQHAYNVFNLCLEAKYGTKNLNNPTTWGTGLSSNDSCNNETTWLANGGVRYKLTGETNYTYQKYNNTADRICPNPIGLKTYWSNWLNGETPKEQCMESQMAMSFANERGIGQGEHFDFYGGEYWYYDVPETDRNDMSARVYKIMSQYDCTGAYDTDGNPVTFDVEVILRMSLYDGATLSGDIFSYNNGGSYLIGKYSGAINGNEMRTYLEPDQRKWGAVQTVMSGDASHRWPFEDTYIYLGKNSNSGNNFIRHRLPWATNKLVNGGSAQFGECAYNYDYCYWASGDTNIGKLFLVGVRSRLNAPFTSCSRRSVDCYNGFANTSRAICASAQVLLPAGWRSQGAT